MATLQLQNLTKTYAEQPIIQDLSLSINDGEFVVIVGPSGCGKSSLLRMIAGLEEVTAGDVQINQKSVNKLEPKHRNIAMVFQNYALYPHMTVYDNMSYALRLRGIGKGEIAKSVAKTSEILELTDVLDRKPNELSGGQRQRVAMGRAIIRQPQIFLFDEPLSNLDAKLRVQMRLEIKKLQRELNITSVYVTHDQIEAMTLADRLVVMNKGSVEQIGSPMDVYDNPASVFTGSFIGSPAMNFIHCEIKQSQLMLKQIALMPCDMPDGPVILGIRPEKCKLQAHEQAITFKLNIGMVEFLGADTLVHGTIVGTQQSLTARLSGTPQLKPSQQIDLYVNYQQAPLFDDKTHKRIGRRST